MQIQAGGHTFTLNLDAEAEETRRRSDGTAQILAMIRAEVVKAHHLLTARGMYAEALHVWEASALLQEALEKIESQGRTKTGV